VEWANNLKHNEKFFIVKRISLLNIKKEFVLRTIENIQQFTIEISILRGDIEMTGFQIISSELSLIESVFK